MPLQRPFSVFVHLAKSDSLLVAQFSVAWLGLQKGCRGETFLQMVWDGLPTCVPGCGCGIFCSWGVSPRGQRAPRRRQEAAFRCKYSQTVWFPQVKMSKSQKSPQGLRIRRRLLTWKGNWLCRFQILAKIPVCPIQLETSPVHTPDSVEHDRTCAYCECQAPRHMLAWFSLSFSPPFPLLYLPCAPDVDK